jgi:deoxyhypusine synthase
MNELLKRKVEDMNLDKIGFSELVKQMESSGGFSSKNLAKAVSIIEDMKKDDCIKFLSFPACVIATGLRGAIAQMIEKGLVDKQAGECSCSQ